MPIANRFAPYEQHGVGVVAQTPDGGAIGDCPWCRSIGKGGKKFYIRSDGQVWDCKTCGKSGNLSTFFLHIFRKNAGHIPAKIINGLSVDRGGIEARTLRSWGIGWDGKHFTIPAWVLSDVNGKARLAPSDLRMYRIGKKMMSSAGSHAGLIMPVRRGEADFHGSKTLWVCEGEWDGMAWWEALRSQDITDDVVAVPGAAVLPPKALDLFSRKDVVLLYDNDSPGQLGQEKAWKKLEGIANSIRRLVWSQGLPDGFDIRDMYIENGNDGAKMVKRVKELLTSEPYKKSDTSAAVALGAEPPDEIDTDGKGLSPRTVVREYKKWLKLDQEDMLDIAFGTVFANRMDMDPLWMFMVGPPGCGKSELLMSLSAAPLVHCTTGLTNKALVSGMNVNGKDPSLIPKLVGKTWICKDFTTVIDLPQIARDEIFSVLRDAYDGKIERAFGSLNAPRRYEGRFGIIAGVTGRIDAVTAKNVVLGERFIRWRYRPKGKVLNSADTIMQSLDNMTAETGMREELRQVARRVLNRPVDKDIYPKIPRWFKERLVELAQWVASMRGVVERDRWTRSGNVMISKPVAEVGTRLAKQFCALAMGIGIYHNAKEINEEIYQIVATVARDTCPDRAEEIVRALYILGGEAPTQDIAAYTTFNRDTVICALEDLALFDIVRKRKGHEGIWALSSATNTIFKRLKLYDHDRAWKWAKEKEE